MSDTPETPKLVRCERCWGRGYKPEDRRSGRGLYFRCCPGCGGSGQRPEKTRKRPQKGEAPPMK